MQSIVRKCVVLLAVSVFALLNVALYQNYGTYVYNSKEDIIVSEKTNSILTSIFPTTTRVKPTSQQEKYIFSEKYPSIQSCETEYKRWNTTSNENNENKPTEASKEHQELKITRAIIVYFPIDKFSHYIFELKWLYRSWIEMMKYEPPKWRTDLVIFTGRNSTNHKESFSRLSKMNCSFNNTRHSKDDLPMCTLIECTALKNRVYGDFNAKFASSDELYSHLLNNVNIFDTNKDNLKVFYKPLTDNLKHYANIDSIVVAFDGYEYLKKAGFDFALKTDTDVFLTPAFGKWLPENCNSFYAGNGGYSTDFNLRRLKGIAKDLNLEHASEMNIGSSWFGTPDQFRIVSYLTLFSMLYLSQVEFTQNEREDKIGTLNWPYWHYGVLSMYGSDMAINHFKATKEFQVIKLSDKIDYPTMNSEDIDSKLHLHVFHGEDMFSKSQFKANRYDKMKLQNLDFKQVKNYALKMALEGKHLSGEKLSEFLKVECAKKV